MECTGTSCSNRATSCAPGRSTNRSCRGRDLPARSLAEHRKIYLEYEGEIAGNRGSVRRVDEGTYRVLEWSENHVRVELAGTQLVGEVDLRRDASGSGDAESWIFRAGNFD